MRPLDKIKRVHFTGIKGVGMAGLAIIAKQMGLEITGSDVAEEFITDAILARYDIKPDIGFDPVRIKDADLVVATGAHGGKTNPEPQAALAADIPVMMHAEALGYFSRGKKVIAVSGCHGKSTTSAMLAWTLEKSGFDPSFLVGTSEISGLGFAAKYGQGDYFVIEADEYMTCPHTDRTPRFLYLDPFITIVTNIEHDHPDRYKTIAETKDMFLQLMKKTPEQGHIISCLDSQNVRDLLQSQTFLAALQTYGYSEKADLQVSDFTSENGYISWQIKGQGVSDKFCLTVPGEHNALNATAVYAAARCCGVDGLEINAQLCGFRGLKRRFELKGEKNNIKVYDDYGHHPTEIKATLKAAREWYPESRIITVFQAHTYSRTQVLFGEFCRAFQDSDIVIIPKIFPSAREHDDFGMDAAKLACGISRQHPQTLHIDDFQDVLTWLKANLKAGDILLTMGAGDVYHIGEKFLNS